MEIGTGFACCFGIFILIGIVDSLRRLLQGKKSYIQENDMKEHQRLKPERDNAQRMYDFVMSKPPMKIFYCQHLSSPDTGKTVTFFLGSWSSGYSTYLFNDRGETLFFETQARVIYTLCKRCYEKGIAVNLVRNHYSSYDIIMINQSYPPIQSLEYYRSHDETIGVMGIHRGIRK